MKFVVRFFSVFFVAFTLLTASGCTSMPNYTGTGEYIDDSTITARVKAKLNNEPNLRSAEINVATFNGTVQLSGFVNDRVNISRAVEIARSVRGVKSVKNDIQRK